MIINDQTYLNIHVQSIPPTLSLEEKVRGFVNAFLHPFITGQITEKTDDPQRKPMMEILVQKLNAKEEEVSELALTAYLEAACMGLYVNQSGNPRFWKPMGVFQSIDFTTADREFNTLFLAVITTVPRDFPKIDSRPSALKGKLMTALRNTNKTREEALIHQYDKEDVIPAREDRNDDVNQKHPVQSKRRKLTIKLGDLILRTI